MLLLSAVNIVQPHWPKFGAFLEVSAKQNRTLLYDVATNHKLLLIFEKLLFFVGIVLRSCGIPGSCCPLNQVYFTVRILILEDDQNTSPKKKRVGNGTQNWNSSHSVNAESRPRGKGKYLIDY